ncbi:hypothetical protein LTR53_015356 [Teratosphaeriaceae sp. CCFEE 6253]|nr:hypothetical protein LTR53_015356 [Teratosphaeriaceae sp. CCFEE 6253]
MNNPRYPTIATRAAAPSNLASVESMLNDLGIHSSTSATHFRGAERAAAADLLPLALARCLRPAITAHGSTTRVPVAGLQGPVLASPLRNGVRSPSLCGPAAAGSVFPGWESILGTSPSPSPPSTQGEPRLTNDADNISATLPPIATPPAVGARALHPCLAPEDIARTTPRKPTTKKADRHDFVVCEDDTAELHAHITPRTSSRRTRRAAESQDIVLYEDDTAEPALGDRKAAIAVAGAGNAGAADANSQWGGEGGPPAEVQRALAILMRWLASGAPARRAVLGEVSGNSSSGGSADEGWGDE